ncbi:hypothetical protein NM688_g2447 [Phlebia brevispora]|uniref:Uncharacterized protein n=1 Tax=Phlebia brevispora TaxID=194682 RepID=A0ACC1T8P1_9APHY|nr:hypothetical protein NM688_g2447 [Phlebia brevispora]
MAFPSGPSGRSFSLKTKTEPPTPSRRKRMHSQDADIDLDSGRKANLYDAGQHIHEIAVETFFKDFLPPVRNSIQPSVVMGFLKQSGTLTDEGWKDFPIPKTQKRVHENICYEKVKKIVTAIAAAAQRADNGAQPWVVRFEPHETPKASFQPNTCQPDCTISLRLRDGEPWWDYIAVTGEFKKEDRKTKDHNSNIAQLIWDMNQTMRNDPSRRFTFGYSIENTDVRLWRCDRSDIVISGVIDFVHEYPKVVHFFLSFLFAEPDQLGWDPTMERIGNTNNFFITVGEQKEMERRFRTTELLSYAPADALRGRGTRVWKSEEVDANGNILDPGPFALKDTWIDSSRTKEGEILETVRGFGSTAKERQMMEKGTLSVRCHGHVYINGRKDLTLREDKQKDDANHTLFEMKQEKRTAGSKRVKAYQNRIDKGSPVDTPPPPTERIPQYNQKVHYRIVYAEVGTPLHCVKSANAAYKAICQVLQVLQVMHTNGWVHRDISTTNILIVDGHAKLGDFEYAKRCDKEDAHKIRTANVLFTPVEIAVHELCFSPPPQPKSFDSVFKRRATNRQADSDSDSDTISDIDTGLASGDDTDAGDNSDSGDDDVGSGDDSGSGRSTNSSTSNGDTEPPVRFILQYTPAHDVESLFWIAVYFVVNRKVIRVGGKKVRRSRRLEEAQEKLAHSLFSDESANARSSALSNAGKFHQDLASCVHSSLARVVKVLSMIRGSLYDAYSHAQSNMNTADWFVMGDEVHNATMPLFFEAVDNLKTTGDVEVDRYGPR